ncbi:F-box domain-containing protein [Mycena indigotica]|uniref:F-box domain-containing protein n=1 Tax=Mycena indigotica TaxID=2126181 RepID=A0A8H6SQI1_9AGAR|nr:F-box domain-containing protein [Mycena indigotica]KAF7304175.1 F-box domain-containing protein [Mycena indigotica]
MSRRSPSTEPFSSVNLPTEEQWDTIQDLCRANSAPSGAVATHTEAILEEGSTDLELYDEQLERYEEEIAALKEAYDAVAGERDVLRAYMMACRSTLAPIRRLPPELLLEIFKHMSPTKKTYLADRSSIYSEGISDLSTVAEVCVHWRRIIIGTPVLWSNMNMRSQGSDFIVLPIIRLCLKHSASLPLDIVYDPERDSRRGLRLLATHAERWRRLEFRLSVDDYGTRASIPAIRGRLPLLESLSISSYLSLAGIDAFEVAPKLTTVRFNKVPPKLPWAQLFSVTAELDNYPWPKSLEDIRAQLAFLAECFPSCAVTIPQLRIDEIPLSSPVTDLQLSGNVGCLSIGVVTRKLQPEATRQILGQIMQLLDLPRLQTLYIRHVSHADYDFISWPHHAFAKLARRAEDLTSLFLQDVLTTPGELAASLAHCSALRSLYVQDIDRSHEWLWDDAWERGVKSVEDHMLFTNDFARTFANTRLVPCLEVLAVAGYFLPDTLDDDVVADFLAARSAEKAFHFKACNIRARKSVNGLEDTTQDVYVRLRQLKVRTESPSLTFELVPWTQMLQYISQPFPLV